MRLVKGHLVGFEDMPDLEEKESGYTEGPHYHFEIGDCPETKSTTKGKIKKNVPYNGPEFPSWVEKRIEQFKAGRDLKGINWSYMRDKMLDGFSRKKIIESVKKATTKEEKMDLLENFHKEGQDYRKRTALKLPCMEEVRLIRQWDKQGYTFHQITKKLIERKQH